MKLGIHKISIKNGQIYINDKWFMQPVNYQRSILAYNYLVYVNMTTKKSIRINITKKETSFIHLALFQIAIISDKTIRIAKNKEYLGISFCHFTEPITNKYLEVLKTGEYECNLNLTEMVNTKNGAKIYTFE